MPSPTEDQIFTAKEIRVTTAVYSDVSISGSYKAKTIFIENGLNQQVTFQLQASRNSVWIDVGSTFDVAATTNTFQTVETYFPKYKLKATCSTAPTSGDLDCWIIKVA